MQTYQITLLVPGAQRLLEELANLKLIRIEPVSAQPAFSDVLERIRLAAAADAPTLEEITAEVEAVRAERYAGK